MRTTTMLFHVFALAALVVIPSVTASPKPSGYLAARDATPVERRGGVPSPYYRREPAPVPSGYLARREPAPVPSGYYARREPAPVPSGYLHKRDAQPQQIIVNEELVSRFLCPNPMRACPISPEDHPATVEEWIHTGFECVDDREDLTSCGGCGLADSK